MNFIKGRGLLITFIWLFCFKVIPVFGVTFVVTSTADSTNETFLSAALVKKLKLRGGVVSEPSLRGAVRAANRLGGRNTILLKPLTYQLTLSGAYEDNARSGDLDVTQGNLAIAVAGSGKATIDAMYFGDRIFEIASSASLNLTQVKMTHGNPPKNGGAILNAGNLVLKRCVFIQNTIFVPYNGSSGGGVINGTPFSKRSSSDKPIELSGGALFNLGVARIDACAFLENNAADGSYQIKPGHGGAICNRGAATVFNSVIARNRAGFIFAASQFLDAGGDGGAIWNDGELVAQNTMIERNLSGQTPREEFGIFSPGHAGGSGAGIYNVGNAIVDRCSISRNFCGDGSSSVAENAGNGGDGGGIYNLGRLLARNSTVLGNVTGNGGANDRQGNAGHGGSGAGIFNSGLMTLINTTISQNTNGNGRSSRMRLTKGGNGGHGGSGAGIYNLGDLRILSGTISSNVCGFGGNGAFGQPEHPHQEFVFSGSGGDGGNGGGVFNAQSAICKIANSIVTGNLSGTNGLAGDIYYLPNPPYNEIGELGTNGVGNLGADVFGDYQSEGFNLISISQDSTGFTNGIHADLVGTSTSPIDPLLGPLQMNGGPTPTHALLPGSPAIDAGKSFGLRMDQRGRPRPHNLAAIPNAAGGDGSDIGAFEK
ncbi:MAG: choice-of-anchor Q domain-containing protein [Verrucomicrobiota bacterium]